MALTAERRRTKELGDLLRSVEDVEAEEELLQQALAASLQDAKEQETCVKREVEEVAKKLQEKDDHLLALFLSTTFDDEAAVSTRAPSLAGDDSGGGQAPSRRSSNSSISSERSTPASALSSPASSAGSIVFPLSEPPLSPPAGLAKTFKQRRWLTDASISFIYDHLLQVPQSGDTVSSLDCFDELPEDVLLLDAATSFWITMQTNPCFVRDMIAPLDIQKRQLVLCPLNDNRDTVRADGGTHWGLLVWDRRGVTEPCGGEFIYYDSGLFGSECASQADKLASSLCGSEVRCRRGSCARQENFYDCGMYVLLFSEIIVDTFLKEKAEAKSQEGTAEQIPSSRPWERRLKALKPADVSSRRASIYRWLCVASSCSTSSQSALSLCRE